jgi:hypothetical protein
VTATQSSDLAGTIYAKVIENLIIAYQYDETTAIPYARFKSIAEEFTATAGFPRKVKNAVATIATETTISTTTAMTTTNVDIAVSRVGIARGLTETAREDSIVGRSLYIDGFVQDAAVLFGESMDTDFTALFASITAAAGTTGVALSLATMVLVMATQRANKARGQQVIHMHDLQLKQLQQAQIAATATPWAVFFQPNNDNSQFGGYFMNAPVWASSKNPTINTAADRAGAAWSAGQGPGAKPDYTALGLVVKRMPSSLTQEDILSDAHNWASYMRYGVGIIANNFATKIVSINS